MKGVQFLVDSEGKKMAVVIDLVLYRDSLEDFFDVVIARERMTEPRIPLSEIEAEIALEREIPIEDANAVASV